MKRREFIKKVYKAPAIIAIGITVPSMGVQESGFVPPACKNNPNIPACKDRL